MPTVSLRGTGLSSLVQSSPSWTNTANAYDAGTGTFASLTASTQAGYPLVITGYNFSPYFSAADTVESATVTVKFYSTSATAWSGALSFYENGAQISNSITTLTMSTTSTNSQTFSLPAAVTQSKLINGLLEANLSANKSGGSTQTFYVDYVQLTVTYRAPITFDATSSGSSTSTGSTNPYIFTTHPVTASGTSNSSGTGNLTGAIGVLTYASTGSLQSKGTAGSNITTVFLQRTASSGNILAIAVGADNTTATTPIVSSVSIAVGTLGTPVIYTANSPQSTAAAGVITHLIFCEVTSTTASGNLSITLSTSVTARVVASFLLTNALLPTQSVADATFSGTTTGNTVTASPASNAIAIFVASTEDSVSGSSVVSTNTSFLQSNDASTAGGGAASNVSTRIVAMNAGTATVTVSDGGYVMVYVSQIPEVTGTTFSASSTGASASSGTSAATVISTVVHVGSAIALSTSTGSSAASIYSLLVAAGSGTSQSLGTANFYAIMRMASSGSVVSTGSAAFYAIGALATSATSTSTASAVISLVGSSQSSGTSTTSGSAVIVRTSTFIGWGIPL